MWNSNTLSYFQVSRFKNEKSEHKQLFLDQAKKTLKETQNYICHEATATVQIYFPADAEENNVCSWLGAIEFCGAFYCAH